MSEDDIQFRDVIRALKLEEFVLARDLLYPLAADGDAQAQYLLAHAYRGMTSDPNSKPEMCRWYEKAASHGHAKAAFELACLLDPDIEESANTVSGAAKDSEKAQGLYRQAMQGFLELGQRGDAESQSMLGVMYLSGLGISWDTAMALHWFSESYRNGYLGAANNLCSIYYSMSAPTDQDRALARYWYERSKSAGCQYIHIPELD